jgi:hypothetical protein
MIRAYHFLLGDMRSDENMIIGNARPWRIGRYIEVQIDAGHDTVTQRGYYSSPTLWSALFHADGPVACLVEVSEPFVTKRTRFGTFQISRERRLLDAYEASAELRLFACDCASRVLQLYEPGNRNAAPRTAIDTACRFARGECSLSELEAALSSAREAAEAAIGKARIAAYAATATAFDNASDAAMAASWGASWAAGRAERARQRRRLRGLNRTLFQP